MTAVVADRPCIEKRYVEVGGRLLHYRVCGNGPPVVLLHDSPRSSRLHLQTMLDLAPDFRVFALDTPGYGNSDALDLQNPTILDFAAALGEALTELGLEGAPLYATHTSSKIALALAVRGGKMPALLLDGLSIPIEPATDEFLHRYMRPFRIEDTGGYLATEWGRTRDMLRWFPWFEARPENRIPIEPMPDAWMADYVIDLFSAGPNYSDAYAAAMRWSPADDLLKVQVETRIAARADDVLFACLDMVPTEQNPALTVERLPGNRPDWLQWLRRTLQGTVRAPAISVAETGHARTAAAYVSMPHGQLHFHRRGTGGARPMLILSAPTSLQAHDWAHALSPVRETLVPDLPGFGESDPLPEPCADQFADALAALISSARDTPDGKVDVWAIGIAAGLAARLAARHPALVAILIIDGAPPLDTVAAARMATGYCPDVRFDRLAGSHLHRIWHMLRDSEVQWPWYDEAMTANRHLPPALEAEPLHRALTGILRQPTHYADAAQAAFGSCTQADWAAVPVPTLLLTHKDDPAYADAPAIANIVPHARTAHRPDRLAELIPALDIFCAESQLP